MTGFIKMVFAVILGTCIWQWIYKFADGFFCALRGM